MRVIKHSSPVWRDRADVEIDVVIPEASGDCERLYLRRESDNRYVVCCLPFSLYGFSLGDTISLGVDSPQPARVVGVEQGSGRFCFRAILSDGGDSQRMASLSSTFASMGCMMEVFSSMMVSIDAEDEDKADWVLAVLRDMQSQGLFGKLEFETVYSIPFG